MNHLLRRPRPRPSKPPTNFDTECHRCGCGWHGTPCKRYGCDCPTAWTEPA